MKKKVTKIVSCLLCLAMLTSMAGPALAAGSEVIFAPDAEWVDDEISLEPQGFEEDSGAKSSALETPSYNASATLAEAAGEYEIYPTPHSVVYGEPTATLVLPDTIGVTYDAGIDQYTIARAEEAFGVLGVTLRQNSSESVQLRVRISQDVSQDGKTGSHSVTIGPNSIEVVGEDTDAAFYGLTTLKRIFQQVENKTVRQVTIHDYADVPFRGFIEGYYGNPWTVDDRAALMAFGGEYKMNIYFYAPKDDPKHRAQWRDLYDPDELQEKIVPLAQAGNESKCYYGYALHPFASDPIDCRTEEAYQADMTALKAKYEQVISAGVRQIALLGDDANLPPGCTDDADNSYVRILNDLTDWLASEEMQTKYPGLKTSVPFCSGPSTRYGGNGSDNLTKSLAPVGSGIGKITGNVPIIMTGGRVWGHVEHSFLNTFTSNVGVGPFLWINWPCSDNSKTSLTFGAHDVILHSDLTETDVANIKGVMLNPMQQSEPSKAAIFQAADYTWNIWNGDDSAERIANVWEDCFKYVDHDSAIETAESAALRELGKHMIRQNGNGNNSYNESIELAPKLTEFRSKMSSGTLTTQDIVNIRAEFQKLYNAAVLYKGKETGNTRILGERNADGSYPDFKEQMAPWLDCWEDFTGATIDLLDALKLIQENGDSNQIMALYLSGQASLTASQSHKFWYLNHFENAEVGGQHLIPFTNDVLATVADAAKTILNPNILTETIITSRNDTPENGLEAMRDGDEDTIAVFKSPVSLSVGDYMGVRYNRAIEIDSARFVFGYTGSDAQKNSFAPCKLQYMDEDGNWVDVPGTATKEEVTNNNWSSPKRVLSIEQSGLGLTTRGIRAVVTEGINDVWIGVKEIYINGQSGSQDDTTEEPVVAPKLTGTVIKSPLWGVASGSNEANLTDGNDDTFVWYDPDGAASGNVNSDHSVVGDYLGLDLGSVQAIGQVRFVVGGGDGDKWTNFKLQYSTDNLNWSDGDTFSSTNNKDIITTDLNGTEARYVRFVNTVDVAKWVKFSELSVYGYVANAAASAAYQKLAYQSETVKKLTSPAGVSEDNSASISAASVTLRAGEFIGINLGQARNVTSVTCRTTPATVTGLTLTAGASEAELKDASAGFAGNAHYIRLENTGSGTISFRLDELTAEWATNSVETTFVESTAGALNGGESAGAWFDGELGTSAKFNSAQRVGNYVLYDFGYTRDISKVRLTILNTDNDYPRNGVVEVAESASGPWATVLTVTTTLGAGKEDYNNPVGDNGSTEWLHDTANYYYQENTLGTPVSGRYIRYRITSNSNNWLRINEITINDNEYVSGFDNPAFEVDPTEGDADYTPDKAVDGDLTTAFRPNMTGHSGNGSFIYHLSGETSIGQINVLQQGVSGAEVFVRTDGDNWTNIGTLDAGLKELEVPERIANVLSIKFTWPQSVSPVFTEIVTVPREAAVESGGGQASAGTSTTPINSYSGLGTFNFDENWKFNLGDDAAASQKAYNDAAWTAVNLPHDFSIDLEPTSSGEAESGYYPGGTGWYRKAFTVDSGWADKVVTINFGGAYMDTEVYLNGTKLGEHHYGYTPFAFVLPSNLLNCSGENVLAVKVTNTIPSSRWYSGSGLYRSVLLDAAEKVHVAKYGVKVETTNAGAVTVKTTVENSGSSTASVTLKQEIFELDSATYEKTGSAVATVTGNATSVSAGASVTLGAQTLNVSNPKLWSSWDIGTPNLYVLKTTVLVGGTEVDTNEVEFGFRTIAWDADTGFKLNGQNLKLKGVCQHHDQGGLGAEAWYRALERQVEILMDMGCNAIRVTHNPAADELIEICNRKGMLIIDEAFDGWSVAKNGNAYDFARWFKQSVGSDNPLVGLDAGDMWYQFAWKTMIKRDMNAPCVIMYSLGNEIQEGASFGSDFIDIATDLIAIADELDNTRFLTKGDNERDIGTTNNGAINQMLMDAGGIVGFNYAMDSNISAANQFRYKFPAAHEKGWRLYGAETASHVNSRGVYNIKGSQALNSDKLLTSYDKSCVGWGQTVANAWWDTIRYDYNGGEFVWTGFDYIGEPTPNNGTGSGLVNGANSPNSSFFGAVDTNGLPKDSFWLYRSMWNDKSHTLHILPTWDADDLVITNGKVEVAVYSDAPMVKLYLNDKLVGSATSTLHTTDAGHTYRTFDTGTGDFTVGSGHTLLFATFNVTYETGTLRAEACDADGTPLNWVTEGRSSVRSTSGATRLRLTADRANILNDGRDLSYITIDVVDANGEIINGATPEITVSVSDSTYGTFMALDNGVQPDHTLYNSTTRKAGAGQLVAIVQSTKNAGKFTVRATAGSLSGSIEITTSGAASSTTTTGPVSYDLERTFYVQLNTEPTLPTAATVTLGDGSTVSKAITWDEWDKDNLKQVGEFGITGTIADYNIAVSVNVVVIDKVVALLNYSTGILVGATPILPAARPAVMADGTVASAQFDVTWTEPASYDQVGLVEVPGVAHDVFGKDYNVTAFVRVAESTLHTAGSASGAAIPVDNDDLQKAYDSNTNTVWTGTGETQVRFDTSQNLYRIVIHYSGSVPAGANAPTITLYAGASDTTGTTVTARPTISGGNTATYELGGIVSSEFVKITFPGTVSVTDIDLITAIPDFPIGAAATLPFTIDGAAAEFEREGTTYSVSTSASNPLIAPENTQNVALTILPENADSQVIIVTESEDHNSRAKYVFQLDAIVEYPYVKTTASAPSQQTPASNNVEGPIEFAVDNDPNTYWHSKWSEDLTSQPAKRYIQLTLEEAAEIVGLRYVPRPTVANGIVTEYRIEVSSDGTNFTPVASGDWAHDTTTKTVRFDPVVAKYVRLYGVQTRGGSSDIANKFMSCAELRVLYNPTANKIDLSPAEITITGGGTVNWTGVAIQPSVTVSLFGEPLRAGTDYYVDYENNVDPGTAYIYARAADGSNYVNAASTTFTIVKPDAKITSLATSTIWAYPGEYPNLPETVMANFDDGTRQEVAISWDAVDVDVNNPPSTPVTVSGEVVDQSLLASGSPLKATITVRYATVESVEAVSVAPIAQGASQPTLPDKVTVYFSDGTNAQRSVTWDWTGFSSATAGTVTVTGAIQGISGTRAEVNIRIAELIASDKNFALNDSTYNYTGSGDSLKLTSVDSIFPMALAFWSSNNNNPYQAIQGNTAASTEVAKRWSDWESGTYHTSPLSWLAVAFESAAPVAAAENTSVTLNKKFVNQAKVMFVDEGGGTSGAVTFPADYEIQYYTGPVANLTFDTRTTHGDCSPGNGKVRSWTGSPLLNDANWTTVTYSGAKPAVPSANGNMLIVNFDMVETALIRVLVTPKTDKWTGIAALEVYGAEAPAAKDTATVTGATLNYSASRVEDVLDQFTQSGSSFTLDVILDTSDPIPTLALTTDPDDNATVTYDQIHEVPGSAVATVRAENGDVVATYTVSFTRLGASTGGYLTLDVPASQQGLITVTGASSSLAVGFGQTVTVSPKAGYEFNSFTVTRDDTNARVTVTTKGLNREFIMPPTQNVTVTASVTPVRYTITYDLAGGTAQGSNPATYTVASGSITLNNPTRSGYVFKGWIGSNGITPSTNLIIAQGSTGHRSYQAVWEPAASGNGGGTNQGGTVGGSSGGSSVGTGASSAVTPVGSVTSTTTNPATGATTVTTITATGLVTAVTTSKDGTQSATIQIPTNSSSIVDADMPALNAAAAPEVKVQNNTGRPVTLTLPITGGDTVVAVRAEADGSETVIPLSIVDSDGLHLKADPGDQTIRVVDNAKAFSDVPATHWAASAVGFASSRELFNGMGDGSFAPTLPMDRAMMTTVLWRLAEKPHASLDTIFDDVQSGAYYEEAATWGVATGVVKGTSVGFEPNTPVTREMIAVLLYRAAGSPTVVDEMPRRFADGAQVSDWAQAAVIWCIQNDILRGRADGTLDPKTNASRAEVATMLQRYVANQV